MMFILWIPLVVGTVLFASWAMHGGAPVRAMDGHVPTTGADPASEILRRRLALGEITPAQYEEMRRTLGV
jgi:uncharacterized membrane protein